MSTENQTEFDLSTLKGRNLESAIKKVQSKTPPLCTLTCGAGSMDELKDVLCRLRAEGVAFLVLLKGGSELVDESETLKVFATLRDWDQLLVRNILELCIGWIPAAYHDVLRAEAKTELKWFEQWQSAAIDPRIHRYPALPWRSFLRKINAENYEFISELMELTLKPATPETQKATADRIKAFLEAKKKTICIFPKRWN